MTDSHAPGVPGAAPDLGAGLRSPRPVPAGEAVWPAYIADQARLSLGLWAALMTLRLLAFPQAGVGTSSLQLLLNFGVALVVVGALSVQRWRKPKALAVVLMVLAAFAIAGVWGASYRNPLFTSWAWPLLVCWLACWVCAAQQVWPQRGMQIHSAGLLLACGVLAGLTAQAWAHPLAQTPLGHLQLLRMAGVSVLVYACVVIWPVALGQRWSREQTVGYLLSGLVALLLPMMAGKVLVSASGAQTERLQVLLIPVLGVGLLVVLQTIGRRLGWSSTTKLGYVLSGLLPLLAVALWQVGEVSLPFVPLMGVYLAVLPKRWRALQAAALVVLAAALLASPRLGAPAAALHAGLALGLALLVHRWLQPYAARLDGAVQPERRSHMASLRADQQQSLWRWSLGLGLAATLAVAGLGWLWIGQQAEVALRGTREAMVLTAEQIQRRLLRAEAAAALLVQDIREHVGAQAQAMPEQAFDELAAPLSALVGPGVNLQWAPKGVYTNVYAPDGNIGALGLDLLNDPSRRDEYRAIVAQRVPSWSQPFALVEGGQGLAYRVPVFAADGGFQGLATLLLKLPAALLPAGWHPGQDQVQSVALGQQLDQLQTIALNPDAQAKPAPADQASSQGVLQHHMALVAGTGGQPSVWREQPAADERVKLWLALQARAPDTVPAGLLLLQVAMGAGLLAGLLAEARLRTQLSRAARLQGAQALERLQGVMGLSVLGKQLFGSDGSLRWFNPAVLSMFQESEQDLQGLNLFESPVCAGLDHQAMVQRTLQTGQVSHWNYHGMGRRAQPLDVALTLSRVNLGGEDLLLLQAIDMHEPHARERELQALSDKAETLLAEAEMSRALTEASMDEVQDLYDQAPCGYHSIDAHGRVTRMNQTELAWLQRRAEEVIGRPITDFMTPATVARCHENLPKLLAGQDRVEVEFELVRADGSVFDVVISAVMQFDQAGQPLETRATVFDITERKQRERALARARDEANAASVAKSQFLATISHEIRTPLNWVMGMLQVLGYRDDLSATARTQVHTAYEGAQVLLAVLNDVLDYSGLSAGKQTIKPEPMRVFDSVMYIKALGQKLPLNPQVQLDVSVDPRLTKLVLADDLRLRQILLNLVSNAVKFTHQGLVRLSAEMVTLTPTHMGVRLVVQDTGIGMNSQTQARLFEPFMQADMSDTRSYGGTGLGLAISKNLLDAMGARIEVESALGEGTTFTMELSLPLANEASGPLVPRAVKHRDGAQRQAAQDELARNARLLKFSQAQAQAQAKPRAAASAQPTPEPAPAAAPSPLPLVPAPDAAPAAQPTSPLNEPPSGRDFVGQLEGVRVLVVDDDNMNTTVGQYMLQAMGAIATPCLGAQRALDLLQDPTQHFEVVLMDLQMPDLDGLQATRRIRQHPDPRVREVLVLAMTGRLMNNERELAKEAGMNGFISKPLLWTNLVREIQAAMAERDARQADGSGDKLA